MSQKRRAVAGCASDIVASELRLTNGHIVSIIFGCILSVQLFQFWLVNGIADFSTAIVVTDLVTWDVHPFELVFDVTVQADAIHINAPAFSADLTRAFIARVIGYILIVPAFVLAKLGYYALTRPNAVLAGRCPRVEKLFSLDWFTSGVLMTTLPLAVRDLAQFLVPLLLTGVGIYGAQFVAETETDRDLIKLGAIIVAGAVFLWLGFTSFVTSLVSVPTPASVSPLLTAKVPATATEQAMRIFNALLSGPVVVAAAALVFNALQADEEIQSAPLVSKGIQGAEPSAVVMMSAYTGTFVFLLVNGVITGQLILTP